MSEPESPREPLRNVYLKVEEVLDEIERGCNYVCPSRFKGERYLIVALSDGVAFNVVVRGDAGRVFVGRYSSEDHYSIDGLPVERQEFSLRLGRYCYWPAEGEAAPVYW